jgi:hypothetical protein
VEQTPVGDQEWRDRPQQRGKAGRRRPHHASQEQIANTDSQPVDHRHRQAQVTQVERILP